MIGLGDCSRLRLATDTSTTCRHCPMYDLLFPCSGKGQLLLKSFYLGRMPTDQKKKNQFALLKIGRVSGEALYTLQAAATLCSEQQKYILVSSTGVKGEYKNKQNIF